METLFIPNENDFKRWIKEAVKEYFDSSNPTKTVQPMEELLNRKETAAFLRISLVTLNDWVNRGLPSHKQRGRVYFEKKEVLEYIRDKKMRQIKLGSKLFHLKNETSSRSAQGNT